MRAYEIGIKGWPGTRAVFAATAGKAKYRFIREVDMDDLTFRHLTCRSLGDIPVAPTRTELAQREADAFNARYPVGTMMRYWSWTREGEPTGTASIKHVATVVCEGAVCWMDGVSSCHSLTHVEPALQPSPAGAGIKELRSTPE